MFLYPENEVLCRGLGATGTQNARASPNWRTWHKSQDVWNDIITQRNPSTQPQVKSQACIYPSRSFNFFFFVLALYTDLRWGQSTRMEPSRRWLMALSV